MRSRPDDVRRARKGPAVERTPLHGKAARRGPGPGSRSAADRLGVVLEHARRPLLPLGVPADDRRSSGPRDLPGEDRRVAHAPGSRGRHVVEFIFFGWWGRPVRLRRHHLPRGDPDRARLVRHVGGVLRQDHAGPAAAGAGDSRPQ